MRDISVHKQIEEEIRQRIKNGQYRPGDQIPPDNELVEEFKASRLTVARGMNSLVQAGWLERSRGRGTFVRNPLPEGSPQAFSGAIKYLSPSCPDDRSPISFGVLRGLHEGVRLFSKALVGIEFYHSVEEQIELLRTFREPDHGGFVVWPASDKRIAAELANLRKAGFPHVQIDNLAPGSEGDFVGSDNFAGAGLMIDHLAAMGHRRIAYITVPLLRNSVSERLGGVFDGLVRHGLPFSERSAVIIPSDNLVSANELSAADLDFLRRWLTTVMALPEKERPSVIFCCSDSIAICLWHLLAEMKIRVPDDIALAGYDNIDQAAWPSISLTTVAQDFYNMGKVASQLLFDQARDIAGAPARHYRLAPKLVIRNSTPSIL